MQRKIQLKKAYDLLSNKKKAAKIYGVSPHYFLTLIENEKNDVSTDMQLLHSIKEAASKAVDATTDTLKAIESIEDLIANGVNPQTTTIK